MNNTMNYKGYVGSVEYLEDEGILYGKVQGIRGLIQYDGKTVDEFKKDFHDAVDDYLAICEEEGKKPEVPYKGSFNVRISPELHRNIAVYAINHNKSLNSVIEDTLERAFA